MGFAIGSAAPVSLALFGAYVSRAGIKIVDVLASSWHQNQDLWKEQQNQTMQLVSKSQQMLPPKKGSLVVLTSLIAGTFFGLETLAGVRAGSLISGIQVAISASNTGGAWDNAKKYIRGWCNRTCFWSIF